MHDATVLANYINALPLHPVVDEIERAFELYRSERIEWVERAFNTSQMLQALVAKVRERFHRACVGLRQNITRFTNLFFFSIDIASLIHIGFEADAGAVHDEKHARVLEATCGGTDVQL